MTHIRWSASWTAASRPWAGACCGAGWSTRFVTRHAWARGTGTIEALLQTGVLDALREQLRGAGDVERILTRVGLGSARPRDLSTLRSTLACLPDVHETLAGRE